MATTFDVFYLGTGAEIDPTEGNTSSENAAALVGTTFGSTSDPLYGHIQSFAPGTAGFGGGNTAGYDVDNTVTNDQFTIDGGPDQTMDGTAIYNATITYADGSTASITATVVQDTAGNLYLMPRTIDNADQAALEAMPIRSLTLDSVSMTPSYATGDRVAGTYPDGVVDGTTGNDSMGVGYTDGDGDQITSGDDSIDAGAGNDSVQAGDGNDTIFGGTGDDTIFYGQGDDSVMGGDGADLIDDVGGFAYATDANYIDGGAGNDTIYGGDSTDTILGGDGDDYIQAHDGDDIIYGGTGADTILADLGDDTIFLEDNFGNDSISGGSGNENNGGDVLDLSLVTQDTTVDLTSSNPENGSVSDGTDTATFTDIENIVLGGGRDTIVLADGSGTDTVQAFDLTDSGDGSTKDQLDVSGLTDAGGNPVNVADVTVTDTNGDGSGDAILSFPNGESITLVGVLASQVDSDAELEAMGIPAVGPVDGTAGDDDMRASYIDAEGDQIDGADGADDTIYGYAGNDTIYASAGNDTVYGGDGNDRLDDSAGSTNELYGEAGNDFIGSYLDDNGASYLDGGAGNDTLNSADGDNVSATLIGGDGDDLITGWFQNATVTGDSGDDTIEIDGGWGAEASYTMDITGGETGETTGDVLDGSGVNEDMTLDMSGADPESGTITHGTQTITFTEIESVETGRGDDSVTGSDGNDSVATGLGADTVDGGAGNDRFGLGADTDRDVVVLADGSGSDTVSGFDLTDSGDGTTLDQLDVSGLTSDGGTTPVTTADVVVTDDGSGNAVLTFPGGESITLLGVAPAQVDDPGELHAMGIPSDGVIEGTDGDDTIDAAYTGDPDGNMVDNLDHSDGSNADSIVAGDGNDTVLAGADNDTILGGLGDDSLLAGDGNDSLYGEDGADTLDGGAGDDVLSGSTGDDVFTYSAGAGADTITDFNTGNTGTLSDGDNTNNDFIDLSAFYDNISELHADQADDGILNQSNDGVDGVDYSDNDSFGSGSLTFTDASADGSFFTVENTGVVCFTSGTAIRTPQGERLIDELRIGDLVTTMDNGPQRIRWIGRKHLDRSTLLAHPNLQPILIPEGVLAATRNLLVSPQHGMLLGHDNLVRAIHLKDAPKSRIRIARGRKSVTYIHLMFDAHQIVFADNAPSESFYPGPMAQRTIEPSALTELRSLFPELNKRQVDKSAIAGSYGETARPFLAKHSVPEQFRQHSRLNRVKVWRAV